MQVLVDTSVWSLALRRVSPTPATSGDASATHKAVALLEDLIMDSRATMIGAIRQELLSGIKSANQFQTLSDALSGFEDIALSRLDYELAAKFFNTCRSKGIQGSNTDFLICAAASSRKLPILTADLDFAMYKLQLPIALVAL